MTSKQKIKGNRFEVEIVRLAEELGYKAERARGSDGRAMGMDKEVDVVIYDVGPFGDVKAQAKIRKSIAEYLNPGPCDAVIVRQDRGEPYIVMRLKDYLEVMKCR